MDWISIVATLLKIAFVLGIIFTFAPVLVWAERRQSAMIQDRLGPIRAGVPLPLWLRELAKVGAQAVGFGALGAGAAALALGVAGAVGLLEKVGIDLVSIAGIETRQFVWIGPALLAVGGVHVLIHKHFDTIWAPNGDLTVLGLLHPLADALKMIWKEDFVPPQADRFLHAAAPIIALVPALATFAVIPFADTFYVEQITRTLGSFPDGAVPGRAIPMQVANINVGILYIFAIAGTGVVGAAIAGYSSNNKYSLLGGLRAAGQMVSYEVTLGLSLVGCFMVYDTLLLNEMVAWQQEHRIWGVFVQPLAFILFFTAATAESKRIPFDVPEGESELVGGYFTEYSGMKFGMFFMGEFAEVVVSSALLVTLFFGGYDVPFLHSWGIALDLPWVGEVWRQDLAHGAVIALQLVSFLAKLVFFCWLQLMVRWTLPRFRYDQIMKLCWRVLLPLSLANILLTGVGILLLD